jgi:hypothetical protein
MRASFTTPVQTFNVQSFNERLRPVQSFQPFNRCAPVKPLGLPPATATTLDAIVRKPIFFLGSGGIVATLCYLKMQKLFISQDNR